MVDAVLATLRAFSCHLLKMLCRAAHHVSGYFYPLVKSLRMASESSSRASPQCSRITSSIPAS